MNRLFLLYFPGYFDGDKIIGIYDDISKLNTAYKRVINDEDHEYESYLDDPHTKLTIEEFDREKEEFYEVDPKVLWDELDNQPLYGKGPFFLLVADEWSHDEDEWLGIYTSRKDAREAYDRATVWWEEERKKRENTLSSQKVTLFEYIPEDDHFRVVNREELEN